MKKCPVCQQYKYDSEFYKNKTKKNGLSYSCKTCSDLKERHRNLKKYGLSEEDYIQLCKTQNYKCKICGVSETELQKKLCIDHDHKTGKVRGLLCNNCNLALGYFKDDIPAIKKAIDYLNSPD